MPSRGREVAFVSWVEVSAIYAAYRKKNVQKVFLDILD